MEGDSNRNGPLDPFVIQLSTFLMTSIVAQPSTFPITSIVVHLSTFLMMSIAAQSSIPLMVRSPRSGRLEPRTMAMETIERPAQAACVLRDAACVLRDAACGCSSG